MAELPAIVCTLTTKELAARSLRWADLAPLALSVERLPDGTRSTYSLEWADAIERLAASEHDCCGTWLQIGTVRHQDEIELTLTTPNPDGLALIERMSGLAAGNLGSLRHK